MKPILGHTANKLNVEDPYTFCVIHPEETVTLNVSLYEYIKNSNYETISKKGIAALDQQLTDKEVTLIDAGWAFNAPERISWITIKKEDGTMITYVNDDKRDMEFFNKHFTNLTNLVNLRMYPCFTL